MSPIETVIGIAIVTAVIFAMLIFACLFDDV